MSRTHATRRELAPRVVAEMARTATQRWRAGAVPRTPTDITAAWLSDLLGRRVTMRPALARAVAGVRDHDSFARLRRQFT